MDRVAGGTFSRDGGTTRLVDLMNPFLTRTHSCFGGQYYGVKYNVQVTKAKQYAALTVSVLDPGRGRSRFSTV